VAVTAPSRSPQEAIAGAVTAVGAPARRLRVARALERRRDLVVDPLVGAAVLVVLARPGNAVATALLALTAFVGGALMAREIAPQAALLPLMRHVQRVVGPLLGVTGLALIELLTGRPHAGPLDLLAAVGVIACTDSLLAALFAAPPPGGMRAAHIGSPAGAARLARALEAGGSAQYRLVGRISCAEQPGLQAAGGIPHLGPLQRLDRIVVEERIDLLVMGSDAPRLAVFGQMADTCLDLRVRLVELSELFEELFGHVPTADINPTWFQFLACREGRAAVGPAKRTVDLLGAGVGLLLLAPLLAVLIVAIKSDGAPGLFRQVRIGEKGRPFALYKLRTMRIEADATAQWAAADDPRITRLGGFLRASHLDELPQLANVLRGEMSLVGPRPEQPEFVDRLERTVPFYQRRHLLRPGITGWAQIRCGYAGSDIGSAWKLCHDLFYAKHRSLGLDLLILCETFSTLLFEREPVVEPESFALIAPEPGP
jgi:lipopolysaccharide/colanic/teichoic acid biosynthesis glycosyltransferase